PPIAMDALVAINFGLAALIMVRAASLRQTLDFSVFPALLLGTTLLRLVTNIASTRLILSADTPTPQGMEGVAGELIESFGRLVAGSSAIVGAAVFLILVVVQFVVITKGAGRMSEVAARFALDALPGRQMAIDADVASGSINEAEAHRRRESLLHEADFFGAMDGASRFVRGDAIAGLLITGVNVVGGLLVGVLQKGWTVAETLHSVTILTIGDGLAAQIPAFVISIAAGLVVARAGRGRTLGEELPTQLAGNPATLAMMAAFMGALALTPLPMLPLLTGAGVLATGAWLLSRERTRSRNARAANETSGRTTSAHILSGRTAPERTAPTANTRRAALVEPSPRRVPALPAPAESARRAAEIGALLTVEPLEVELGAALTSLARGGERSVLLRRIEAIRKQIVQDLGIVVPPVRVRDERQLPGIAYRIRLRGTIVGEGELRLDDLLAMSSDGSRPSIPGIPTREPAFGLEAVWIAPSLRPLAEAQGCAVASPESVLGAHLATVVRRHADELLTREHVSDLLAQLRERAPRLVDETVPAIVKPGDLQRVMQLLLRERVPVRDLESLLEAAADAAPRARSVHHMAEAARLALRRAICQQFARPDSEGRASIACVVMGEQLDRIVADAVDEQGGDPVLTLTAERAAAVVRSIAEAAQPLANAGLPVVVVSSRGARAALARLLTPHIPGSAVLAFDELVRGIEIDRVGQADLVEESSEVTA
ncbi:MAG: FHIPEP family type III secretion protein, partial [Phycisphaerae bacterium]|nr:FHIPEP family type III secretion protein [Phycisphaerae bacterium]